MVLVFFLYKDLFWQLAGKMERVCVNLLPTGLQPNNHSSQAWTQTKAEREQFPKLSQVQYHGAGSNVEQSGLTPGTHMGCKHGRTSVRYATISEVILTSITFSVPKIAFHSSGVLSMTTTIDAFFYLIFTS